MARKYLPGEFVFGDLRRGNYTKIDKNGDITFYGEANLPESETSSSNSSFPVVQNNSYSDLQPVYWNGTIWALANSLSELSIGTGIISDVTATGFTVNFIGKLTKTAHGLGNGGEFLYVTGTDGVWTTTKPTTGISNPLAFIHDANTIIVLNYRAAKTQINFIDMVEGFALTGHGGKALTIKSDVSGFETATMPNEISVEGGANTSVIKEGNVYTVAYSGAENPTNPFPMTIMAADPTAAAAGEVNYYSKAIVGIPQMFCKDENSIVSKMRIDFQGDKFEVYPYSGTSLSSIGCQYSSASGLTVSHPTPAAATLYHYIAWYGTAASSSSNQHAQIQHRANCNRILEGMYLESHMILKQSAAMRLVMGFTSDGNLTTESNSDNASTQFAGISYSSTNSDTTFQVNSRDVGGTRSRTNSAVTYAVDKLFKFYLVFLPNVQTLYWRIVNVTDGTDTSGTKATNMPDTTVLLRGGIALTTTENVQKDLYFKELRIYGVS